MAEAFGARVFLWTLQLFWASFFLLTALLKIFNFGLYSYTIHLTNWSWTLLGLFLLLTLSSLVESAFPFVAIVVAYGLLPIVALVFSIAIGVWVLLASTNNFLTDIFARIAPGIVIIGNDVYHFIPVLTVVFFAWVNSTLIVDSFRHVLTPISGDTALLAFVRILFYAYQLFAVLVIIAAYLFYLAVLDTSVNEVYDTQLHWLLALALAAIVSIVFAGVPLLLIVCCYI